MFCVKCGNEIPSGYRFCGLCGATVEVLPPERVAAVTKGDVVVDRSTTSISQVTHTDENSAKVGGSINISVGGDRAGSTGLVVCPWCGVRNDPKDTFLCHQCKRDHLCRDHHDRTKFVCKACAGSAPATTSAKRPGETGHFTAAVRDPGPKRSRTKTPTLEAACAASAFWVAPPERRLGPHGMEFVLIPAGEFLMGSPEDEEGRSVDEDRHRVRITKPFFMQTTCVTQGQWRAVMGDNPSFLKEDDRPVTNVSWNDVHDFLRRLYATEGTNYRLPTEAEWEYACRAGTTTPFCFGKTITTDQANFDGNLSYGSGRRGLFRQDVTRVKNFPPNVWGLYDMHGNVWEWCSDWYGWDYYKRSPPNDPKGPATGQYRVLRGGAYGLGPQHARAAARHNRSPGVGLGVGFRCAQGLS